MKATALPMGALRERLALSSYTTTGDTTWNQVCVVWGGPSADRFWVTFPVECMEINVGRSITCQLEKSDANSCEIFSRHEKKFPNSSGRV